MDIRDVAISLINTSAEKLDSVRIWPLIEALASSSDRVEEPRDLVRQLRDACAREVRTMRKVEEIEEQIRNLSGAELTEFRKWYAEFDAQTWNRQIEADVKARKLDALGEAARRARREGKSSEL